MSLFEIFLRAMKDVQNDMKANEELSEEKVNFTKGNYKHEFVYTFTKNGHLVGSSETSQYIPTQEETITNQKLTLEKQLEIALDKEDYLEAAEIKNKLQSLETKTN